MKEKEQRDEKLDQGEPETRASDYAFTPDEAAVFRNATLEAQAKINELNALVRLVVSQQKLAGNWQLKQDSSGLVKV